VDVVIVGVGFVVEQIDVSSMAVINLLLKFVHCISLKSLILFLMVLLNNHFILQSHTKGLPKILKILTPLLKNGPNIC